MEQDSSIAGSGRNLRAMLALHREPSVVGESDFCSPDNLDKALTILSEELESLGFVSVITNNNELQSVESWKSAFARLINASWGLARKHRALMKTNDLVNDTQHKINSDNTSLTKHVKRLKDDLEKKQQILCESLERERRLKVKCDNLSRDLKREKDETVKLKKQLQSKDSQHAHELKRIQQNSHKLREQLQKSVGTYVPKDRVSQNMQTEHEKQLTVYKQTIRRLEENNGHLLRKMNSLTEALTLHADAIDLQEEASGIWNDADI